MYSDGCQWIEGWLLQPALPAERALGAAPLPGSFYEPHLYLHQCTVKGSLVNKREEITWFPENRNPLLPSSLGSSVPQVQGKAPQAPGNPCPSWPGSPFEPISWDSGLIPSTHTVSGQRSPSPCAVTGGSSAGAEPTADTLHFPCSGFDSTRPAPTRGSPAAAEHTAAM